MTRATSTVRLFDRNLDGGYPQLRPLKRQAV